MQFVLLNLKARFEDVAGKERGATAVEYGLLVALIAAVIIAVVGFLGADIRAAFNVIEDQLGGNQGGN